MSVARNKRGQFAGGPMDPELKALISQGQVERYRRQKEHMLPRPNRKRCTKCRQIRRVPQEYYMRTRILASGEEVHYPPGECKYCSQERARQWRENLGEEERKKRQVRYNRKRIDKDPEDFRRKQRELSQAARIKAGVKPRGPWKKYRQKEKRVLVDAKLFFEWMHWARPQVTESERRRIDAVRSGAEPGLELGLIDRIMNRYGATDQFHIFYGDARAIQDDAA